LLFTWWTQAAASENVGQPSKCGCATSVSTIVSPYAVDATKTSIVVIRAAPPTPGFVCFLDTIEADIARGATIH
jgi:hypothetical protein